MRKSERIANNRKRFLNALRFGNYKKGTIKSDRTGRPIINTVEDNDGSCACAIMIELFTPEETTSTVKARKALGITGRDCYYIQHRLNDSPLTFSQIADKIESQIFNKSQV